MTYATEVAQTANTTEFNGWCNKETWVVNLWLNNDIDTYEFLQSTAAKTASFGRKPKRLKRTSKNSLKIRTKNRLFGLTFSVQHLTEWIGVGLLRAIVNSESRPRARRETARQSLT